MQHASARSRTAAGSRRLDRYERIQVIINRVETSGRRAGEVGVIGAGGDMRGDPFIDVVRIVREGGLDRRRVEVSIRIDGRIIQAFASETGEIASMEIAVGARSPGRPQRRRHIRHGRRQD